jgi:ferredoxin
MPRLGKGERKPPHSLFPTPFWPLSDRTTVIFARGPMAVQIRFLPDDVVIEAEAGELLLEVARRAGIYIPTGCLMGSCHACEVELEDGTQICSCISGVPLGRDSLTVYLYGDPLW